jgi:hypothetical protein
MMNLMFRTADSHTLTATARHMQSPSLYSALPIDVDSRQMLSSLLNMVKSTCEQTTVPLPRIGLFVKAGWVNDYETTISITKHF